MTQGPHSELVQDAALVLRAVHVAEGLAGRTDSVQRWYALELWTVVYYASHNQRGVGSPVIVAVLATITELDAKSGRSHSTVCDVAFKAKTATMRRDRPGLGRCLTVEGGRFLDNGLGIVTQNATERSWFSRKISSEASAIFRHFDPELRLQTQPVSSAGE